MKKYPKSAQMTAKLGLREGIDGTISVDGSARLCYDTTPNCVILSAERATCSDAGGDLRRS